VSAVRGLNEIGPRQLWLSAGNRATFDRLSTVLADAGYTPRRTEHLVLHLLRVRVTRSDAAYGPCAAGSHLVA
jgi:hypothetical protein